jgi:dTDP-4-amino-4,6-dideoxygalactose transaminase
MHEPLRFAGSFTQQEPIPDEGVAAALAVLGHARLHRYSVVAGEVPETAALEEEFAAFTGARYALAVASGGYAIATALRALRVGPGEAVLSNAFTLAPVPGAIAAAGARPVFVETAEDLTIDLHHLRAQVAATGARVLVVSHMRGHIGDMDALMALCDAAGVRVVEDCAHTMGAAWGGVPSGRHGAVACYSTQTYKHINSGEGGLIATDDDDVMARAILLSGSYMLYARHRAAPPPEAFERLRLTTPNISGRMDNLRAAVLRPQLRLLPDRVARWRALHDALEDGLRGVPGLATIPRGPREEFVGSSFQFRLPDREGARIEAFVARCAARGVELKWFGAPRPAGYTSRYDHWEWAAPDPLPQTDRILATLIDLRLPLTFTPADARLIGAILAEEAASNAPAPAGPAPRAD